MDLTQIRLLIVSDTHCLKFDPSNLPCESADVIIHRWFHNAIQLLQSLDAPLKLVIAGNHDFTLGVPSFKMKIAEAVPSLDPALVTREYGTFGRAKEIFAEAQMQVLYCFMKALTPSD